MTGIYNDHGCTGYEIPSWLSALPEKRRLYGTDIYYRESWDEICAAFPSAALLKEALFTHAVLLFKPDSIVSRKVELGFHWLAEHNIKIVAAAAAPVHRHTCRALWGYQWNIATRDRRELIELMMSQCDSLLVVVKSENSQVPFTTRLTSMKGPAEATARKTCHLRHAMGTLNTMLNWVHSTDEPADVVRELSVLLTREQRDRVYAGMLESCERPAIHFVLDLYARTVKEPDLAFAVRFSRWKELIFSARDQIADDKRLDRLARRIGDIGSGSTDWRSFVADASDAGIPWTEWDTIVLGTTLMSPHEPGIVRMIPNISLEDWAPCL